MADRRSVDPAGKAEAGSPGRLFVCGTPIGNLEDVTLRVLRVLGEVDIIAAEDTRRTRKLLAHYDIHTPLVSLHEHNEQARTRELLRRLQGGQSIALVSDAGMPGISDPGAVLVAAAAEAGVDVVVVPGPSAFVAALVGSGLATDRFAFEGFLPRQGRRRRERLQQLSRDPRTLIFYEAPHRLARTLQDMLDVWGDRPACVARELTKTFEQWQRAPLSELAAYWAAHEPRGEFVIVVAGADASVRLDVTGAASAEGGAEGAPAEPDEELLAEAVRRRMAEGLDKKTAIKAVADEFGLSRRIVYRAALSVDASGRVAAADAADDA